MKFNIENIDDLSDSREVLESKPNKFMYITAYGILFIVFVFLIWSFFSTKDVVVEVPGTIMTTIPEKQISSLVSGKILSSNFKEGDKVKKGDIIYTLDASEFSNNLEALNTKISDLEKEKVNLEKLSNSINENKNYFSKDENEEYYIKFNKYSSDLKSSETKDSSLSAGINQIQGEINNLNNFKSSIENNKNLNSSSDYTSQFNNYMNSIDSIDNEINSLQSQKESIGTEEVDPSIILEIDNQISSLNLSKNKLKDDTLTEINTKIKELNNSITTSNASLNDLSEKNKLANDNVKNTYLAEIETNKKEVENSLKEVELEKNNLEENIDNYEIKSEEDGVLHFNNKYKVGGVIQSGETIANILPSDSSFEVEVLIPNSKIAEIKEKQKIRISIDALPSNEYGFIEGKIENISTDSYIDENSGTSLYIATAKLDKNTLQDKEKNLAYIKKGMTISGKIIVKQEKMIQYFINKILK